jgi:hypothetical protein
LYSKITVIAKFYVIKKPNLQTKLTEKRLIFCSKNVSEASSDSDKTLSSEASIGIAVLLFAISIALLIAIVRLAMRMRTSEKVRHPQKEQGSETFEMLNQQHQHQ